MSDLPLDEILTRALALDPEARSAYLDETCGEDSGLRSELDSLLGVAGRFPAKTLPEKTDPPSPPPLPDRIGRYPVIGVVGAGGMGLVYRARDPELEREIALKRLPAGIRAESAELARFRREARVLARLSHPNIATVYSLESDSDEPFLTMELVPGRTLHAVLADEPLPVARALRIGLQIAAAMEAAHAEGIVHRDLKPLNIQVGEADEVKVLDFGLAKALDEPQADPGADPGGTGSGADAALTVLPAGAVGPVTELGRVVGTPGYISPEQLRGQPVGPPADVWAFGCILFECLTGNSPYRDQGSQVRIPARFRRTLAALDLDPDWSQLPEELPAAIGSLLRSCLHAGPAARPASTDVRGALERTLEEFTAPPVEVRHFTRRTVGLLTFGLAAIVAAVWLTDRQEPLPAGVPPSTVRQLTFHGNTLGFDLAPDGETAAYIDETGRLVYLDVESGRTVREPITTGAAGDTVAVLGARSTGLRWSPDGRELSVVGWSNVEQTTTATFILPRDGHRAVQLGPADFAAAAWSPDGRRVAGTRGIGKDIALCIAERESGRYRDVLLERSVRPTRIYDWSIGDRIYFKIVESDSFYAVSADGGTPRAVMPGSWLHCLPSRDAIQYILGDQLRQIPLDAEGLPTGDYLVLADRMPKFASPFAVAVGGRRIMYDNAGMNEVWLGQRESSDSGEDFRWAQLVRESLSTNAARFSPDGSRIALAGRPAGESNYLLLVHSLADGTRVSLGRDSGVNSLDWSPDGTELVYRNSRGMARVRLDERVSRQIPGPRDPMYISWLPDGRIVYMERDGELARAYRQIDPADGSISRLPIDETRGTLFQFAVSPHGNLIAVAGNRGGRYQVKVWLIDLRDGSERLLYDEHAAPFAWSADGAWVYVVTEIEPGTRNVRRSRLLRVAVDGGAVETVADLPEPATGWSNLDLNPDETSIVYTQRRTGRDLWLMDIGQTRN